METGIWTGIITAGILATSVAQAADNSSEKPDSGLHIAAIQQERQIATATQQATERKSTCDWDREKDRLDPLYLARLRGDRGC